jgi:two-component system, NarL family, response regulator DevR
VPAPGTHRHRLTRVTAFGGHAPRPLAGRARLPASWTRAAAPRPEQTGLLSLTSNATRGLQWIESQGYRPVTGKDGAVDETAQPGRTIGVFLLDDHEIVRKGVRDLLEAEPDIKVVGEAGTAESALARIPALHPDVAVLDVRLPDGDGVSVCREIRSRMPEVACLMLTSFGDDDALFDAIMAGAAGYVLKQIRGTDLVGAVRTVASGQSLLDPQAASRVMARMRDRAQRSDPLAGLTEHERRILELIGEGLTNRQIGERMFLAEKTVKNYVSGIFAKLGMERRTQAAAYAARVFDNPPDGSHGSHGR